MPARATKLPDLVIMPMRVAVRGVALFAETRVVQQTGSMDFRECIGLGEGARDPRGLCFIDVIADPVSGIDALNDEMPVGVTAVMLLVSRAQILPPGPEIVR